MKNDPIVDEVRKVRDEHARKHRYDLDAIFADLRACEASDSHKRVSLPPKPSLHQTGT